MNSEGESCHSGKLHLPFASAVDSKEGLQDFLGSFAVTMSTKIL